MSQADILQKILDTKQQEVAERSARLSLAQLKELAPTADPVRGFLNAMQAKVANGQAAVIAEIKKASPSKGIIRADFDPPTLAQSYAQAGAACLSVLTDAQYFQGHEDYLKAARSACTLPVIRKDFILDPYQIYEARAIGADCILLIVSALNDQQLNELYAVATELGMDVLIEVHDRDELLRTLPLNAPLIGINNRNLGTFFTDVENSFRLAGQLPQDAVLVSESGISDPEIVNRLRAAGFRGFLIGETFMKTQQPGETLQNFLQAIQ